MMKNYKKEVYDVMIYPSITKRDSMIVSAKVVTTFEVDGKEYADANRVQLTDEIDQDVANAFWKEIERLTI